MMQAYVFMKGPGTDMEDPLMAWISEQEGEDQEGRDQGSVQTLPRNKHDDATDS